METKHIAEYLFRQENKRQRNNRTIPWIIATLSTPRRSPRDKIALRVQRMTKSQTTVTPHTQKQSTWAAVDRWYNEAIALVLLVGSLTYEFASIQPL